MYGDCIWNMVSKLNLVGDDVNLNPGKYALIGKKTVRGRDVKKIYRVLSIGVQK